MTLTAVDIEGKTLATLSELLSAEDVPGDLVTFDADVASLLDQVLYTDATFQAVENGYLGKMVVVLSQELALAPFGDVLKLVLGAAGSLTVIEVELSLETRPGGFFVGLSLLDVPVVLRADAAILQPLLTGSTEPDPSASSLDIALANVTLRLATEQPVGLEFSGSPSVPRCMIGETGIILSVGGLRWLTPGSEDLPADTPSGFTGLYLENVTTELVGLELSSSPTLELAYAFLGRGGVTAAIALDNLNLTGSLVGFEFELQALAFTLEQNALTECAIAGTLELPFFDQPVSITLSLATDGSFQVTLAQESAQGLVELTVPDLGTFQLVSLGLSADDDGVRVRLGGVLDITVGSPDLQWPTITIQELGIGPDGQITIAGGWVDLQEPVALDLYGFRMEISQIGFGNEEDGRRWIGFSGGVHLVDMLPTGASVEGLRVIWDPTGARDPEITLQGVGIELTLPGVLYLDGDVALVDEEDEHYFKGNAKLDLLPLGIKLDASVKIGRDADADFNYIYTFLSLELPIGIPLWATGAAIYGISGLYGMNVLPATNNNDWYGWYAGPPEAFNVTNADKWEAEPDGRAFGAGMVLGTLFDAGRVVSAKALFALILPGPVILLNGKANVLQLPPALSDPTSEGIFNALAVLDAQAGNLQLNIDAGWSLAKVIDINASAEAYFDFANPGNWHLYLGQDTPEDRRIRASVICLFHADAYLMIDSEGIAAGFGVSWGEEWKFGPVKVVARAWIEAGAGISWQPPQLEGSLSLGGEFEISVAGFGLGLGVEAILSAKVPTLYWVRGELIVRVKLPFPIKDLEADILLEWKEDAIPPSEDPFKTIGLEHLKVDESWTNLNDVAQSLPTDLNYDGGPIVPLDARPSIVFDRSMHDLLTDVDLTSNNVYAGPTPIGEHTFDYELKSVTLEKWHKAAGTQWLSVTDLYGCWMAIEDGNGEPAASKLQLWAKSPFEFTRQSSRTYRDAFLTAHPLWPCAEVPELVVTCVDWESDRPDDGIEVPPPGPPGGLPPVVRVIEFGPTFVYEKLTFIVETVATVISLDWSRCGVSAALKLGDDDETCWIVFPEPVRNVSLCLDGAFRNVNAYGNGVLLEKIDNPENRVTLIAEGIDSLKLRGLDGPIISRICYETEAAASARESIQEHITRVIAGLTHWESEDTILEPETWYRMTVNVETVRTHNGVENRAGPWSHYGYFQTAGPPGLKPGWGLSAVPLDTSALTEQPYPEGGLLTDLSRYVQWPIPAHGLTPVYRAYDVGVEFNECYVEQMYGADMIVRLLDVNGLPIRDDEGNEINLTNQWAEAPTAELSETELPYVTRIENCRALSGYGLPLNQTIIASSPGGALAPQTSYAAELLASFVLFQGGLDTAGWIDTEFSWSELKRNNNHIAAVGREDWDDYRVEVNVTPADNVVGALVRFLKKDGNFDAYRLVLNPVAESLRLVRLHGTYDDQDNYVTDPRDRTLLWSCDSSACGIDFALTEHSLALSCEGSTLIVEVDGLELARVNDESDEGPLLSGQGGLYYEGNDPSEFTELIIRSAPRQPVYEWSFVTSQFEGLVEQLGSFTGQINSEDAVVGQAGELATAVTEALAGMEGATNSLESAREALATATPLEVASLRTEAQEAAAERQVEAANHFAAIDELLFGSSYRPIPPIVELTEVIKQTKRRALLLESPEPLDWPRLTVLLARRDEGSQLFVDLENVMVVWNEDGTKAWIALGNALAIAAGEYRLHFEYLLDVGLEAPVLRRSGSTLPEVAELVFSLAP